MRHSHLLVFLPLLALAASAPSPPSAVEIAYAPAPGTELTRRVTSSLQLVMDELIVVMDGEEVPPEFLPDLSVEIDTSQVLELRDHVEKAGDGRPLRMRRTLVQVEDVARTDFSMPPLVEETTTRTGTCPLVGRELLYAWDDDASEFEVTFADDEGDEELLAGMWEDFDLRDLLPDGEVKQGDSWSVDVAVLDRLPRPGTGVPLEFTGEFEDGAPFDEDDAWDGEATVEFTGWDDDADGRVALLLLKGEGVREGERPTDLEDVPVVDGTATEEVEGVYEFEGILRWDVEAGVMVGFELECEITLLTSVFKDEGQDGPDYEHSTPMHGTWTVAIEIERE